MSSFAIGKKVLLRTFSAGVHYGTLQSRDGREAVLSDSRRIWYWSGAASLSQLAMTGVKVPAECKFSMRVPELLLTEVIEVLPVTDAAAAIIEGVPEWKC